MVVDNTPINVKKKVVFISRSIQSVDRSKRFTLFDLPGRPVHSDTNSASPGSILVMQQLRATTKSLTCPPLSIASYSFIQLSQQGRQWRERKCPIFDTVAKRDSNPGSLDCKSGILPLSYRAPQCADRKCPRLRVLGTTLQPQGKEPGQRDTTKNHGRLGGIRQTPGYLQKQPCHLPEETSVQLLCAASYDIWCRDLDTDQGSTEQTCGRTDQNGKKYAQHHIQR